MKRVYNKDGSFDLVFKKKEFDRECIVGGLIKYQQRN